MQRVGKKKQFLHFAFLSFITPDFSVNDTFVSFEEDLRGKENLYPGRQDRSITKCHAFLGLPSPAPFPRKDLSLAQRILCLEGCQPSPESSITQGHRILTQ